MVRENRPLRTLLWISPELFWNSYNLIKHYEETEQLVVKGVTSYDNIYTTFAGYNFISKDDIQIDEFDIVIYFLIDRLQIDMIYKTLLFLGFDPLNIIPYDVMRLVGFDFYEYSELKKNTPSIISPMCWGGNTYHSLRLQFKSPFINMYLKHDDYLKLLSNLEYYLSCELVFKEMLLEPRLERLFPVALCDDILLFFNHYSTFDEAKECWDRRLNRLNYNNLFVMFFDEKPKNIERFLCLPYTRKICFVPYNTEEKDVISIPYRNIDKFKKKPFWEIVSGTSNGSFIYYNVFDLLLRGKFTKLFSLKN